MRRLVMVLAVVGMLAPPALAHVTVQPTEAEAGTFARFVVRVPNERDDAATVKVEVQLPEELLSASFQPKEGWSRTVERRERAEPAELHGDPVTDYVASVTWEGGRIEPGEFEEFSFTARVPDEPTTLEFPSVQTYEDGEEVEWIGPADADEPAAVVKTQAAAAPAPAAEDDADDDEEEDEETPVVAWVGVGLGALALIVALLSRRRA